jgi:hypothetical protein
MISEHPNQVRCAFEVVPLMLESTYDTQHLLVVSWITGLS